MKTQRFSLLCLVLAVGLGGCDDGGNGDGSGGSAGGGGEGGAATDMGLEPDAAPMLEDRVRLSYVKSVTPRMGGAPTVDLIAYDFDDDEEFNLTAGVDDVNCRAKACKLSGDMTWIGWLDPDPSGGFELWVAPVDVTRKIVQIDDKRLVDTAVNAFEFTGKSVVWSRGMAVGPEGKIDVVVEPVAGPSDDCPNDDDPTICNQFAGQINGDGAFRVTDFGSLIILISTTLSTMTLDFVNLANGANQTLFTFGEQGGTGSEFSGNLPVSLAPDATYLAVFTRNEFIWRAHSLQAIPNPPLPASLDMFEVKTNQNGDCQREMPYNFNEVRFNPVFSSDSESFYFLAKGDCTRRPTAENPTNRDDFDIMRLTRSVEGPIENMTNNPRVSNWINHDIGDFDLSPDDKWLAFTASRPDNATSRSIWLLDIKAQGAEKPYNCARRAAVVGLDGRQRCEFIADDSNGVDVQYRDLHFHTVQVER